MATYACGNSALLTVLRIEENFSASEGELTTYSVDADRSEVITQRKPIRVLATTDDEGVLSWDNKAHAAVRIRYTGDKGSNEEAIRVSDFGAEPRGQAFVRISESELDKKIEYLRYESDLQDRMKRGLPLGSHLEPKHQRLYYGMDDAEHILRLILGTLDAHALALWHKYRIEPLGAAYLSNEDVSGPYAAVAVIARDGDRVVFYNGGGAEDFRLGNVTDECDDSGDRIIRDLEFDGSELAALQLALDKQWNPEYYPKKS